MRLVLALAACLAVSACAPDPDGWAFEEDKPRGDYFGHLEHSNMLEEIAALREEMALMREQMNALREEVGELRQVLDVSAANLSAGLDGLDRDERDAVGDISVGGAIGAADSDAFVGGIPINMQLAILNMEEK